MTPALDAADLRAMRTAPPERCLRCEAETWRNYCRECDEFFTVGHSVICPRYGEHDRHRTY